MRIFVGWPYDATWVEKYALPLIQAHGLRVLTGKELEGQAITDGVKQRIADADATLFFTTRREQSGDTWKTSDWVVDEIKHASSIKKEIVFEIREEGVEYPNKIHDDRQHLTFQTDDLTGCLVELGKVINRWRGLNFKVKLMPKAVYNEDFKNSIQRRLRQKDYECSFSIRQGGYVIFGPRKTQILREGDDLVIYTGDLPA